MSKHIYIYMYPLCIRINLCFRKISIMSKFSIDYNEVWKEVESAEFVNVTPSNEYDRDSVSRLADLIREGLQFLQHSAQLSPNKGIEDKALKVISTTG